VPGGERRHRGGVVARREGGERREWASPPRVGRVAEDASDGAVEQGEVLVEVARLGRRRLLLPAEGEVGSGHQVGALVEAHLPAARRQRPPLAADAGHGLLEEVPAVGGVPGIGLVAGLDQHEHERVRHQQRDPRPDGVEPVVRVGRRDEEQRLGCGPGSRSHHHGGGVEPALLAGPVPGGLEEGVVARLDPGAVQHGDLGRPRARARRGQAIAFASRSLRSSSPEKPHSRSASSVCWPA